MHKYEVGKPYIEGRTRWEETADYNYRGGEHELRLFLKTPSAEEIEMIRFGLSRFALAVTGPVIWLAFKFGDLPWSDASFNIHLVPDPERQPPPPLTREQGRALLNVILVDADTGIVQALRLVSFSPAFSNALHKAIQAQWETGWPGDDAYHLQITRTLNTYSSKAIANQLATVTCKGGD
jgi:hypothetical protein